MNPTEPPSGVLTVAIVRFILLALKEGRLSVNSACRLVTPWVVGNQISESGAEFAAQAIHGFDIVKVDDLRQGHLSGGMVGPFLLTCDEVRRRIDDELARL